MKNNNNNDLNIGIANIMIKAERPLPPRDIGRRPFEHILEKAYPGYIKSMTPGEAGTPN